MYLPPAPPRAVALTSESFSSYTILTCTTTGSPATTVTWTRDGQPVTIDGHTYSMVQTVTNRASATYENVLIVNPPALGSTFTCTVTNMLGSDTSNSVTGMPGTMCINIILIRKSIVWLMYFNSGVIVYLVYEHTVL